ncbi:hypothetical protein TWF225_004426 [Orbilia oligospora]|nr:hypothetical protein TWF225_004426 [Orbilia oligospora]KAF3267549.1 hypothetical protein TWF128_009085 [Orbilia oligospora]KAF3269234.1 hypothetical protein TWF217_009325 [Orbilia oligospora]
MSRFYLVRTWTRTGPNLGCTSGAASAGGGGQRWMGNSLSFNACPRLLFRRRIGTAIGTGFPMLSMAEPNHPEKLLAGAFSSPANTHVLVIGFFEVLSLPSQI